MVTTRTPINRPPRSHITPRAIELFKQMQGCDGELSQQLHNELHDELQLKPWQWPAIVDPDEGQTEYPEYTGGGQWHPQAQALWRELERRAAA